MHIFDSLDTWRSFRKSLPANTQLGFAPTMGNLHKGHASLFVASKNANDLTASSLFVNPTQFNNPDDFKHYPRTLEQDLHLMEQSGVDFCILPEPNALYADGYNYQITETKLCQIMEGKHRPSHFNGVLTVVMKLLQLVRPTAAYFGEKDYQQYLLIKDMADAFFMDINIIPCETIREESGLAYSSRNNRLTLEQKAQAETFAKIFHQNQPCDTIITELHNQGIEVEYIQEYLNRRFAAVKIGDIRLIDNYQIL
jgi:pantoate--beta-alanine ligase